MVDQQASGPSEPTDRDNRRKVREGLVVSVAMEKTAVVAVVERVRHRRYAKTVQRTKKVHAHDEGNDIKVGDRVRVAEASQELFNLRFQHVTGQLDNYSRLSEVRREVARLNTLLREREIAAAEAAEGSVASGSAEAAPEVESVEKKKRRARVLASRRRDEEAAAQQAGTGASDADEEQNDG